MKEKKYKEVTGLFEKNTFHQFDQWETQALHNAKNRYIYDFSFPINENNELSESLAQFSQGSGFLRNLSITNNAGYLSPGALYGFPGSDAKIMVAPGELLSPQTYTNLDTTINEGYGTIAVNEDALGFVDNATPLTFTVMLDNWVDFFRAGYVEFSIKTNKKNSIIASGTTEVTASNFNFIGWLLGQDMSYGATSTGIAKGDTAVSSLPVSVDVPFYQASSSFDGALINLNIETSPEGKLRINYYDDYNRDNVNFIFDGNKNITDNEWHHVVINFGRPGLIKENGTKFNKRFVEIWIDGQLDKRFDDKVNEYQIFYPTVRWLFNNLKESVSNVLDSDIDIETDYDTYSNLFVGLSEILSSTDIFEYCVRNSKNKERAFSGSIHTYAHGVNIPLSQYEIKNRYRLWKRETKKFAKTVHITAMMTDAIVSTNSKKILKLYWNELVVNGKNGIELDNSYQVESYSVTHKSINSKSEIFNLDKIVKKNTVILANVRAAFTDNVIVNGPGTVYSPNTQEAFFGSQLPYQQGAGQFNPKDARFLDSVGRAPERNNVEMWFGPRTDLYMSGINLIPGDRILLTNQIKTEENGIWIFNGLSQYLTRDTDSLITDSSKNYVVYVSDGYEKNTYWKLANAVTSLSDPQKWNLVEYSSINEIDTVPTHSGRWKDYYGEDRLINFQDDIEVSKYDIIVFMNYPEYNDQIFAAFPNDPQTLVLKQYNDFITSLKLACANGANLFVSSPKLAEDLGIVREVIQIEQEIEVGDGRSSVVNPFQFNEPADRYFDTHRQNAYHVDTEIPGLTDKETWLLTEFINYLPKDQYDYEQWHAKYSYRQFGLQEGNEFLIPSLALRQVAGKDDLPGFRANSRAVSKLNVVAPNNVLAGTIVTSLANTHYHGANVANNEYDDYATTIIVHNGQQLGGTPINGKIFVNCVEDGYTMSREEYNKAVIQVIPTNDPFETNATKQWQYSTSRLNRLPKRINVKDLTNYGQTTPTNGGGGPLVQAATNSSNGIIRSETDRGNVDYQSDLYPQETEEVYPIQEIPVLSMTWLGLKWLAGE